MKPEESPIYVARLHWIIFIWPFLFLCFSLVLRFFFPGFDLPALIFALVSLTWLIMTWVTYQYTSLSIKKKQVILRSGFLVRYTTDVPFSKIESMDIRQSVSGSLFHYGTLLITGTGGTRCIINHLNKPLTCRRYIEQLMQNPESQNSC